MNFIFPNNTLDKKKVILVTYIIVTTISVFAQNTITEDEHNKYWFYKNRLNNKFVNVGLQGLMNNECRLTKEEF